MISAARRLTQQSGSNFYYAFLFLPPEQREALYAVYAFCRLVDDAADDAATPDEALHRLDAWRSQVAAVFGEGRTQHPVAEQLKCVVARFPLRREDMEAVIEGCQWDQTRRRYGTWDELYGYCYRVASAVGLMCIDIFGASSAQARAYATHLGVALQLTNILRDVNEDAARGRIYLPVEDLQLFGVEERDLHPSPRPPCTLRLLGFEAERARSYFLRARALLGDEDRHHLVVAEIMGDIYSALLDDLVAQRFPVERVQLRRRRKVAIALTRFLRAKLGAARRLARRARLG